MTIILGEFATAIRNSTDIKLGIYHLTYERFHPLYIKDKENGFKTQDFVFKKILPQRYELVVKHSLHCRPSW